MKDQARHCIVLRQTLGMLYFYVLLELVSTCLREIEYAVFSQSYREWNEDILDVDFEFLKVTI